MGKKWFKKKKQAQGKDSNGRGHEKPKKERPTVAYEELLRESKEFEIYYKLQNIVSSEEWDAFISCLKEDLPAAFRFTGSKNHAHALSKLMQEKFFNIPQDEVVKPLKPICLPWYPDNLGWQLNLTRKDIRRSEPYWKLHQFLITETETGNISRQEAVSMIPPLLLEVKSSHKVLDMCAAPGSKTAQIIEFLHSDSGTAIPTGVVIANDADNKRCYMLTHQAKRLQSPTLMITNHDAAFMPNIHYTRKDGSVGPVKFDRVLCDVPCSGDGTLRKNFDVWSKWNAVNGANLHGLQMRIARRGLEMLEVGGRLVYSTCSLNPLENESVIHRLLLEFGSCVTLVDVREKLPGLKLVPGLETWTVVNRDLEVISSVEEIPEQCSNYIHKNLFPSPSEDRSKYNLSKCIRILPHHQDTGGFFVAVIEKLSPLPGEKVYEPVVAPAPAVAPAEGEDGTAEPTPAPTQTQTQNRTKMPARKRRCHGYKEEPFFYLEDGSALWSGVSSFYEFGSDVDASLFLTRTADGTGGKNLYFTNALVKDVLRWSEDRIKVINTGVKVFVRCDNKGSVCNYRLAQEGATVMLPFFTGRKLKVSKEDMIALLLNDDADLPLQIHTLHADTREKCKILECGSAAFIYEDGSSEFRLRIQLVGWKGKNSLRCYVARNERIHFLRLLGADTSAFEKNKFAEQRDQLLLQPPPPSQPQPLSPPSSDDLPQVDQEAAAPPAPPSSDAMDT